MGASHDEAYAQYQELQKEFVEEQRHHDDDIKHGRKPMKWREWHLGEIKKKLKALEETNHNEL